MGFCDNIFPFVSLAKANKCMKSKLERLNRDPNAYTFEYATREEVANSVLKDTLQSTLNAKKELEDKAKTSLVAITISAALIFNVIKLINDMFALSPLVAQITLLISFLSLSYMVVAGVLSLYMLSEKNRIYTPFPRDSLLSERDQQLKLSVCIEKNYITNVERNNLMNTSYKSITISIVLIVIIFLFSSIAVVSLSARNEEGTITQTHMKHNSINT